MTVIVTRAFGDKYVGLATGILTLLVLIFGEITPKTSATLYSESMALRSAKSIYFQGRYMDARGLRVGSEDIVASLIAGSDGSIGLQIYNDGREELSGIKVIIDPSRLGLEGKKAAKIVDLLTGEEIALGGENTFSVSIKAAI